MKTKSFVSLSIAAAAFGIMCSSCSGTDSSGPTPAAPGTAKLPKASDTKRAGGGAAPTPMAAPPGVQTGTPK